MEKSQGVDCFMLELTVTEVVQYVEVPDLNNMQFGNGNGSFNGHNLIQGEKTSLMFYDLAKRPND